MMAGKNGVGQIIEVALTSLAMIALPLLPTLVDGSRVFLHGQTYTMHTESRPASAVGARSRNISHRLSGYRFAA